MKRLFCIAVVAASFALSLGGRAGAVIITSNLSEPEVSDPFGYWPVGGGSIGINSGLYGAALSFTTDNNSYQLSKVTVDVVTAIVGANPLVVSITADGTGVNTGFPGTVLEVLSGTTNPSGLTDYTSPGLLSLAPLTTYHVLLTAGSNSSYRWKTLGFINPNQTGPGSIGDYLVTYFNGNPGVATNNLPRMAIVAVPEASGLWLMAVGTVVGAVGSKRIWVG